MGRQRPDRTKKSGKRVDTFFQKAWYNTIVIFYERQPRLFGLSFFFKRRKNKCKMTPKEINFVRECIETDIHRFYVWPVWLAKRQEILRADKYECQEHKRRGQYKRATTVHHVMHVKRHPELALESYYQDCAGDHRQLVSLCRDCHEAAHGYRASERPAPVTEERW